MLRIKMSLKAKLKAIKPLTISLFLEDGRSNSLLQTYKLVVLREI